MATQPPRAPASSAPAGEGISRRIGPFPLWVWLVGVGGVGIWYYRRQQAAAASPATNTLAGGTLAGVGPDGSIAAGVPSTGTVDTSGGTNATSPTPTLQDWANAALRALASAGVSPALAEQAISDFMSGNQLNAAESNIVNRALQLAGYPPETLPFYGDLTPHPTPSPDTHHGSPAPTPAAPGVHPAASLLATENDVVALAGRYGVTVPTGNALTALIRKLPGYKPGNTNVDVGQERTLAAQVGYITSTAHLKTPTWAQINNQAAVIARSHGQNFSTLGAADQAAYQQQANVALLEVFNPVRHNG